MERSPERILIDLGELTEDDDDEPEAPPLCAHIRQTTEGLAKAADPLAQVREILAECRTRIGENARRLGRTAGCYDNAEALQNAIEKLTALFLK